MLEYGSIVHSSASKALIVVGTTELDKSSTYSSLPFAITLGFNVLLCGRVGISLIEVPFASTSTAGSVVVLTFVCDDRLRDSIPHQNS